MYSLIYNRHKFPVATAALKGSYVFENPSYHRIIKAIDDGTFKDFMDP